MIKSREQINAERKQAGEELTAKNVAFLKRINKEHEGREDAVAIIIMFIVVIVLALTIPSIIEALKGW